jgi:hypothetical protein
MATGLHQGVTVDFQNGKMARAHMLVGVDGSPGNGGVTVVRVEKTRPNESNPYAANDAINESASVGTNWTFAIGRANADAGQLVAAFFATDQAANTVRFELDLYDTNPTAINDNAEATRLYANQGTYLGTITSGNLVKKTASSTQAEALVGLNIPFKCLAASASLFGILRTLDAFTPAANQKVQVTLVAVLV